MYGTVGRVRVKPGSQQAIVDLFNQYERERRPKVEGAIASYLYQSDDDPQNLVIVAVFRDKSSYFANADDPEQDAWYRKMAQHFEGDPSWVDGEIIAASQR